MKDEHGFYVFPSGKRFYSVSYLDAMNGGSGLERVEVENLHKWLAEHPGYLIRRLQPV